MSSAAVLAREQLLGDLRRYLVGPVEEQERILESASDRYHTGFLSPSGTPVDEEEDDLEEVGEELDAGGGESILTLANVSQQSAMGMTFQVEAGSAPLELTVKWAEYRPQDPAGAPAGGDGHAPVTWLRHGVTHPLKLETDGPGSTTPRRLLGPAETDGICVYGIVRGSGETR